MPRPTRGRRICVHPAYERFTPAGFPGGEAVVLLGEEYECIRSIAHAGLKQEACARRMAISRHPRRLLSALRHVRALRQVLPACKSAARLSLFAPERERNRYDENSHPL